MSMQVPEGLRYSKDHEWVRVDGTRATVGITDYAQDALGDVVFVQLPTVGEAVEADATFSEVESTKSVSDVFAPLAGTVVEVNEALDANPELINSDPYGAGWICVIDLADATSPESLMDAAAYQALTEG
jgi:glycine cleavage system H protein